MPTLVILDVEGAVITMDGRKKLKRDRMTFTVTACAPYFCFQDVKVAVPERNGGNGVCHWRGAIGRSCEKSCGHKSGMCTKRCPP